MTGVEVAARGEVGETEALWRSAAVSADLGVSGGLRPFAGEEMVVWVAAGTLTMRWSLLVEGAPAVGELVEAPAGVGGGGRPKVASAAAPSRLDTNVC